MAPKRKIEIKATAEQVFAKHTCDGIGNLFCNARFSDVKIYLGEVEIPAHGFVLATQSEYFERALSSKFEEGRTGIFRYNEGGMHAYWRCFKYMYTGKYKDEPAPELSVPDDDELLKHVRVYELARYFGVQGLKDCSVAKFDAAFRRPANSEQLISCIREVYALSGDRRCRMRQTIIWNLECHIDRLWGGPFLDLLREGGDFVVDVVAEEMEKDNMAK